MSEPTPIVLYDFAFRFHAGEVEYAHAQQGRDVIEIGPELIRLVIRHVDGAEETVEVYRAALASLRIATRTEQPPPTDAAGAPLEI